MVWAAVPVRAEDYPSKPVKIIVSLAPGGLADMFARLFAQHVTEATKQAVVVENRTGGAGVVGAEAAAKAPGDGYTLYLGLHSTIAILQYLNPKLPYDPAADFVPVVHIATLPNLLVVHPSVPANNLKELVALSQKSKLDFAVTAIGSAPHLAGIAVEKATNAKWEYIPYKGGSQAVTDTIAGQTQVLMNGMLATLPFVQSGKLKVLGVSKATRVPLLANVPTIAEQGVPGFESGTWQGVLVPAATPPAIVARLSTELTRIIRSPEVRSRLTVQGAEVYTMSPTEFAPFFESERKRWAGVVAKGGLKID
jgi:tripartite-type tricarboxylate transporter receptor subunit TctC